MRFLSLCLLFFSIISSVSYAQNKSLGVGTPSPNPNAALHVESPSGNQGFIMPRLTTAQRTAAGFQGVLTTTETGLMVYDTDLKAIYIWDGGKWASAAKLALPYVDTVSSAPNGSNLFRLVYNGAAAGNVGVAHFENMNPNSGFSAIFGRTNSLTNGVADFIVNNPANNNDGIGVSTNGTGTAVRASTTGTGPAVVIVNSNAANTSPALRIDQTGTANALQTTGKIQAGQFIGDGSLLTNVGGFSLPRKDSIVTATGTTDLFALKYNNAEPKRVLRIENLHRENGSSAVSVGNNASGLGLYVQNTNDTTISSAIMATINSNKVTVPYPVAVYGESTGETAGGGSFRNVNINNTNPALFVEHLGTGASMSVFNRGTNGHGGYFELTKGGNSGSAVYGKSTGLGAAIQALGIGAGPGLIAEQNNGGIALEIPNGGVVLSVADVAADGIAINTKAAIYNVTSWDGINPLVLGTGTRVNGETLIVTVAPGTGDINVDLGDSYSVQIAERDSLTFVYVNGWRVLGAYQP